jgi:hypothetical protein
MQLSPPRRPGPSIGALLLPVDAVASAEPTQTLATDELRLPAAHDRGAGGSSAYGNATVPQVRAPRQAILRVDRCGVGRRPGPLGRLGRQRPPARETDHGLGTRAQTPGNRHRSWRSTGRLAPREKPLHIRTIGPAPATARRPAHGASHARGRWFEPAAPILRNPRDAGVSSFRWSGARAPRTTRLIPWYAIPDGRQARRLGAWGRPRTRSGASAHSCLHRPHSRSTAARRRYRAVERGVSRGISGCSEMGLSEGRGRPRC